MDNKTVLDSKILLWLAGELGWEVEDVRSGAGSLGIMNVWPNAHQWYRFDLEADTPEGAWLREKTKLHMMLHYGASFGAYEDGRDAPFWCYIAKFDHHSMHFEDDIALLLEEIEWLYNKEHDHD